MYDDGGGESEIDNLIRCGGNVFNYQEYLIVLLN